MSSIEVSDTPVHAQIEIPEAVPKLKSRRRHHPIGIAIANFLTLGSLGYLIMGQKSKALAAIIYSVFLSVFIIGMAAPIIATIDGFLVAKRIYEGQEVGTEHCELKFIHKLPLWTDMNSEL